MAPFDLFPARSNLAGVTVVALLVLVSIGAWAQPAPAVPTLSSDQVQRLEEGEVLVELTNAETPIGDVIALMEAPPQAVLDVIVDFDNYSDFMPNISRSAIVGRDGDYYLCEGETDTPWPLDDRVWTVRAWKGRMEVDGIDALVSNWTYVPGSGNLENTEGYWLLLPWGDGGGRTLLRYYLVADIGTWLPDFLIEWGTENLLPNLVYGIRERLADGTGP